MKHNRAKKVKKNINFFVHNYHFHKPYQILMDGTFTLAALKNKFNIKEQLSNYLQSDVKLLTTQCLILETEKLGPKVYGSLLILKQFGVHKCGHEKQTVGGAKCVRSMVGTNNPSRYFIATQDIELQDALRNVPGVPLIYLHGKAPMLEPPSQKSCEFVQKLCVKSMMTDSQEKTLNTLKEKLGLKTETKIKLKKKRKVGDKEQRKNPLSCKKKIKKNVVERVKSGKIRKRRRTKLAAQVKEAPMQKSENQ